MKQANKDSNVAILNGVSGVSLWKATSEQIFEGSKGISPVDLWGEDIPYRGNS